MWTLDGRDRTITVLQHTHRCLTMQTCSISAAPCSLGLSLTHTNANAIRLRQQQGKQGGAYGICGVLVVDEIHLA